MHTHEAVGRLAEPFFDPRKMGGLQPPQLAATYSALSCFQIDRPREPYGSLLIERTGNDYSVCVVRQASRRSWRIGQTRLVKVVFMSYKNTLQADAPKLVAKKLQPSAPPQPLHVFPLPKTELRSDRQLARTHGKELAGFRLHLLVKQTGTLPIFV